MMIKLVTLYYSRAVIAWFFNKYRYPKTSRFRLNPHIIDSHCVLYIIHVASSVVSNKRKSHNSQCSVLGLHGRNQHDSAWSTQQYHVHVCSKVPVEIFTTKWRSWRRSWRHLKYNAHTHTHTLDSPTDVFQRKEKKFCRSTQLETRVWMSHTKPISYWHLYS